MAIEYTSSPVQQLATQIRIGVLADLFSLIAGKTWVFNCSKASEPRKNSDFIPQECVVKPVGDRSGYLADIIVLNGATIGADPR